MCLGGGLPSLSISSFALFLFCTLFSSVCAYYGQNKVYDKTSLIGFGHVITVNHSQRRLVSYCNIMFLFIVMYVYYQ